MTQLANALHALAQGFGVFPCYPRTKAPAGGVVPHGVKEASTIEEQIRKWWAIDPDFNPAITNGVIVDADTHLNSLDDVRRFALLNNIPDTLTIRTGRRPEFGIQWHFTGTATNGTYCANTVCGEIRAKNQYGMAAGAIHPSGTRYEVLVDLPRAPFPPDLLREFRTDGSRIVRIDGKEYEPLDLWSARDRYSSLLFRAAHAAKGTRHHNANSACYFAARAYLAGIFEEQSFQGVILFPAVTEVEVKQQIYRAVKSRYARGERNLRKMLADSWDSGIRAGRLLLDLYPQDFVVLRSLTDDIKFQHGWDGNCVDFNGAVETREYMVRVLTAAGCTDIDRVLKSSRIDPLVEFQLAFERKLNA